MNSALAVATTADVSFLTAARRLGDLAASAAGACFVTAELVDMVQRPCALLLVADPQAAFVALARLMHPEQVGTGVIDPRAVVAADAVIGARVDIAAGAVIGARAQRPPIAAMKEPASHADRDWQQLGMDCHREGRAWTL